MPYVVNALSADIEHSLLTARTRLEQLSVRAVEAQSLKCRKKPCQGQLEVPKSLRLPNRVHDTATTRSATYEAKLDHLLSQSVMSSMAAASLDSIAAGEQLMQLDQAITLTLQEIDENFSQAHQIVTSRILPAIREYESSCSQTWQSARFWKQFFEASAQVSLSQQPFEEVDGSFNNCSDTTEDQVLAKGSHDDITHVTQESGPMASPPRMSTSVYAYSNDSSQLDTPFERLKRDVEASRQDHLNKALERPLKEADMSMPTDSSVILSDIPKSSSPTKLRRRSSARPRISVVASRDGQPTTNPFTTGDASKSWNGIADLRTTPLRSNQHYRDESGDTSLALPDGMSPPVTMQFSVPQSKYKKTPAKEAARRVVHDLLRSVGGDEGDLILNDVSPSTAASQTTQRKSVVGTPLSKEAHHRRDSLPTPPTITKVYESTERSNGRAEAIHSRANLLLDSGEGMFENTFVGEDEESDEDDEDEEEDTSS